MDSGSPVCLVMPFRNEAGDLPEVLASIGAQVLNWSRVRFVGVDSASTDGSGDLVLRWLRTAGIAGEVVRLDRPGISRALNAGNARALADETIVRLDAHTIYEPTYVAQLLAALGALGPRVWWAGGSLLEPVATGFGGRLVRALMTNPMGLGASPWRSSTVLRRIGGNAYLGAFRPGVLTRVGGYDESWLANEDAELAARIQAAGGEIWFVPVRCTYRITRGPWRTLGQWFRYGLWRARTTRRHPATLRARHLAPPLALVLAAGLVLSPERLALIGLYALFGALVFARRERGEHSLVTLGALAFFPLVHVAFASGLIAGWLSATPVRPAPDPLPTASGRPAR